MGAASIPLYLSTPFPCPYRERRERGPRWGPSPGHCRRSTATVSPPTAAAAVSSQEAATVRARGGALRGAGRAGRRRVPEVRAGHAGWVWPEVRRSGALRGGEERRGGDEAVAGGGGGGFAPPLRGAEQASRLPVVAPPAFSAGPGYRGPRERRGLCPARPRPRL